MGEKMKRILSLILFCTVFGSSFAAGNPAKDLSGEIPDLRIYLQSIENALLGETTWKSYTATNLATSDYTGTNSYYFRVDLVDADNKPCRWFNQSVAAFSVSTGGTTGTFDAGLSSTTLTFVAGSAPATLTLTGAFSIGSTVTLSFPALSFGAVSAVTATKVLTFNE